MKLEFHDPGFTEVFLEDTVPLKRRTHARICDETGAVEILSVEYPELGPTLSRMVDQFTKIGREDDLKDALREQRDQTDKETAETLSICAGEDFTK